MKDIIIFNIQTVIKIHNALPVSSATTVERDFRAMKRILSSARNSLTTQLASDFIRLSLNEDILIVRSRCTNSRCFW